MEFAFRCPPPPPVTSSGIPWNECIPETGIPRSSYSTTWLSWFDYSRLSPLRGETFPGTVFFRFFSQSCLKKRSTSNLFVRIIIIIVYFYIGIFNQLWKIWAKSRTSQRSLNNKIDSIYPKCLPSSRNYSRTRFLHFSSSFLPSRSSNSREPSRNRVFIWSRCRSLRNVEFPASGLVVCPRFHDLFALGEHARAYIQAWENIVACQPCVLARLRYFVSGIVVPFHDIGTNVYLASKWKRVKCLPGKNV